MVYCLFICHKNFEEKLRDISCNGFFINWFLIILDSKSMNDIKRQNIFNWICQNLNNCGFIVDIISPNKISKSMLSW